MTARAATLQPEQKVGVGGKPRRDEKKVALGNDLWLGVSIFTQNVT